jgi:hypothetical protein
MKKRDAVKQAKLQKITAKRAAYEKARKKKLIAIKQAQIEGKS